MIYKSNVKSDKQSMARHNKIDSVLSMPALYIVQGKVEVSRIKEAEVRVIHHLVSVIHRYWWITRCFLNKFINILFFAYHNILCKRNVKKRRFLKRRFKSFTAYF